MQASGEEDDRIAGRFRAPLRRSHPFPPTASPIPCESRPINPTEIRKNALLGDYPPRQCGIATFTHDLRQALAARYPETESFVAPVNDRSGGYAYGPEVRFEFHENELQSYRRAASYLNFSNADVVCLQHEFGIYGGPAGSFILALLRDLGLPVVTTLHTVLQEPAADQRRVLQELTTLSARLVVMSERGARMLREVYQVPASKIDVIPHGIVDIPFVDPNYYKDQFGVEGKQVLLTYGLLSPNKGIFWRQIQELGVEDAPSMTILEALPEHFTVVELAGEIQRLRRCAQHRNTEFDRTAARLLNLARANYEVIYTPAQPLSERVIFPTSPSESNGIEDARFVRFVEDDASVAYVATYTAYDGRVTIPQMLETRDFLHFRICTLNGPEVQNKGMALFPRKIDGQYVMLSRQDGENLYLMRSKDLHFWQDKTPLLRPARPWEFLQIGNCGSPIETAEGWLVISHGVGPMRKYSIGAFLLDREDPSRVLRRLRQPLLSPDESEREGYVPNVVYSCGSLVHAGRLILPYAMSDSASSFATVDLAELLAAMEPVAG